MDLRKTSLKAAEAIRHDTDEDISRRAAQKSPLEQADVTPDAPESDMAHALRTRRRLRKPLSTTV